MAPRRASPGGGHARWNLPPLRWSEPAAGIGWHRASGDQAQLTRAGNGLGSVGRAELAQEFTAQPFQHRGLQQERAQLLTLPLEYLLGQVIQDVAVAAGKRRHEPGHIGMPSQ